MSGRYHQGRAGNSRQLCAACRERKARYQYRGNVRADRQHVLCFQCFRSAREQMRAWQLREGLAKRPRNLTPAEVAHRRAMLAHLTVQATTGV
jgi:hypothetical protein